MNLTLIVFYAFAILAIVSALYVIFTKNVLHAAMALLLTFLGVAAIYIFAAADFVAVTQIMIYVGGILVLIIFGIMLTTGNRDNASSVATTTNTLIGILAAGSLFGMFITTIVKANLGHIGWIKQAIDKGALIDKSTVEQVGINLMTDYALPFEVAAILLMVALMGSAFIAGRKSE